MSVEAPAQPVARPPAPSTVTMPSGPGFWDRVHLGLRIVSLVGVAIAMGILARRGELQMIPIVLAGLGIGCAAIVLLFKGPERRYLLTLFLVAFAVRTVAAVVVHPYLVVVTHDKQGTVNGRWVGFLFEDDRAYHKVAWGLSGYWLGRENGGVDRSDFYLLRMYTYIVAFLYEYVYFASPASLASQTSDKIGSAVVMAPKLMNCFVGAFAIVPMFALGRELGGSRAGRLVALAAAFWPSLILWSIVNLKDIMVVTLIAAIIFLALRFARRPGLVVAAALLAVFASLENMRLYVFYAFGWLVPIGFFLVNRDPWRRRLAIGLSLTVAIVVIMLAMNQGTQWLGLRYLSDKRLEAIDSSRVFGSDTAESGIELPDRINRYEGGWSVQLRNVPIVLPYVLFAPFPWHASRIRDFLLMPETLAWYAVEALTMVALVIYGRQRWREYFLPVVFCGGLVFVFSVIEGNVGTIFRHRVMLFPGAFSIAAMGALWIWDGWLSRKILPARPVAPAQAVA